MKIRTCTALVIGVALATGGLAAPAMASSCPSGYHCVYRDGIDDNQLKLYFSADGNFANDSFANSGGVVNDNVSAARNSSSGGYRSRYYYDANYGGGAVFCVNPGSSASVLASVGVKGDHQGRNDEASSLDLASGSYPGCF